jgi:hypothetical protein
MKDSGTRLKQQIYLSQNQAEPTSLLHGEKKRGSFVYGHTIIESLIHSFIPFNSSLNRQKDINRWKSQGIQNQQDKIFRSNSNYTTALFFPPLA